MPKLQSFPNLFELENCCIPLADRTRLAARIWMLEAAEQQPVPALLESMRYDG